MNVTEEQLQKTVVQITAPMALNVLGAIAFATGATFLGCTIYTVAAIWIFHNLFANVYKKDNILLPVTSEVSNVR